jgi:glycosyltransferase involved in cell wall biosynthesis
MGLEPRKIEVTPVPVDTGVFKPGPGGRKGVLFVGRAHDPRKNFEAVLRLVRKSELVRRHGVDVVSERPDLGGWRGAGQTVRWLGKVKDLASIYRRAEVLVLTSHQEGLGIVVFEALASGTPVVSLSCGGPDQLLRESEGGMVVHDEQSLREGVEEILKHPEVQAELGQRGRKWIEENISASKFLADDHLFRLS